MRWQIHHIRLNVQANFPPSIRNVLNIFLNMLAYAQVFQIILKYLEYSLICQIFQNIKNDYIPIKFLVQLKFYVVADPPPPQPHSQLLIEPNFFVCYARPTFMFVMPIQISCLLCPSNFYVCYAQPNFMFVMPIQLFKKQTKASIYHVFVSMSPLSV